MMNKEESKEFVTKVFNRMSSDKGYRARLSRASSEASEWGAWETLLSIGGLDDKELRRIMAICLSSMAQSGLENDGKVSFGKALKQLENGDGEKSEESKEDKMSLRLRRIISVQDPEEMGEVLPAILRYITSSGIALCYSDLIFDLRKFCLSEKDRNNIKVHWVEQYVKGDS